MFRQEEDTRISIGIKTQLKNTKMKSMELQQQQVENGIIKQVVGRMCYDTENELNLLLTKKEKLVHFKQCQSRYNERIFL